MSETPSAEKDAPVCKHCDRPLAENGTHADEPWTRKHWAELEQARLAPLGDSDA